MGGPSRFLYDMREGARRQGNVVFALIFRELKARAGADGYGLLSLLGIIIEPIIAAVAIATFFYLLRRQEVAGVHIALFVAVSYPPFMFFRRCITSVPKALQSSRSFYAFQSVKPFDAILSRYLIELILTIFGTVGLLFLLWWFYSLTIRTDMLLHAFGLVMALLLAGFGMALFIGVYGARFPFVFKTITMAGRALLFLSAVIHPASDLPVQTISILMWNPIAHFEELIREYLLGITPFMGVSPGFFLMFAITALFLGFTAYYTNRFKVLER